MQVIKIRDEDMWGSAYGGLTTLGVQLELVLRISAVVLKAAWRIIAGHEEQR